MVKKTKLDVLHKKLTKEDKEFKKLVEYLQPSVYYIDVMGRHLNVLLANSNLRKEKMDFSKFRHKFAPVKDRMDKLLKKQNELLKKQNELFAKLKELETENLKLRYAVNKNRTSLKRYENIDMPLNREIAQLKEKLADSNKIETELKQKIMDIYHEYCDRDDDYYGYDD